MASLRELVAKAVAAGFTGKGIKNAPVESVRPSPRRKRIGNADFDQLGKRQQKIVRRMAMGDVIVPPPGDHRASDFKAWNPVLGQSAHWQLASVDERSDRRCNVRAKDAKAIGALTVEFGWSRFDAMLNAARSHYQ